MSFSPKEASVQEEESAVPIVTESCPTPVLAGEEGASQQPPEATTLPPSSSSLISHNRHRYQDPTSNNLQETRLEPSESVEEEQVVVPSRPPDEPVVGIPVPPSQFIVPTGQSTRIIRDPDGGLILIADDDSVDGSDSGGGVVYPPRYGAPYQPAAVSLANQLRAAMEEQLCFTWRFARTIKLYSTAHCLIILTLLWTWLWFAVLLPLPLVGFFGAKKFNKGLTFAYVCFIPLMLGARIYATVVGTQKAPSKTMSTTILILGCLIILLEIYVGSLIVRFFRRLRQVSEAELQLLRSGWKPIDTSFLWV